MTILEPIRTETDYQHALSRVRAILQAQPGTPEFEELNILATLVEAYEAHHHPIHHPISSAA